MDTRPRQHSHRFTNRPMTVLIRKPKLFGWHYVGASQTPKGVLSLLAANRIYVLPQLIEDAVTKHQLSVNGPTWRVER